MNSIESSPRGESTLPAADLSADDLRIEQDRAVAPSTENKLTDDALRVEQDRAAALDAENAALKKQLEDRAVTDALAAGDEAEVARRMAVGLTREQAQAVINRQRTYDSDPGVIESRRRREQDRERRRRANEAFSRAAATV